MISFSTKYGIEMDFDGFDSINPSSDKNNMEFDDITFLEQELDFQSFDPMLDPSDYLSVELDIIEGNYKDLNEVKSRRKLSTMSDYSKYIKNDSDMLDAASNDIKNATTPRTASSTIPAFTPPIFVKAKPRKVIRAISAKTTLPLPVNCSTVSTQVTDKQSHLSLNFSGNTKQQFPLISAQPVSNTLTVESSCTKAHTIGSGVHQMFVQSPRITTSSSVQQISVHDSTIIEPSAAAIQPNTFHKSEIIYKDQKQGEKVFPKPPYSFSLLIFLALKNSTTCSLPVHEIYSFICEYFPYYRTAPNGWKNSVRHNLCQNKTFEKIDMPVKPPSNPKRGYMWILNPSKVEKMDVEIQKWNKKDLPGIKDSMEFPEYLESLQQGEISFEPSNNIHSSSEDESDEEIDSLLCNNSSVISQTRLFLQYLLESPNFSINLNEAAGILNLQKRSLEKISLILEGAGLVYRPKKNYVNWSVDPDIEYLAVRENEIDDLITSALIELMKLKDDTNLAYVIRKDLDKTYSEKIVMALKVPPNTMMKVPEDVEDNNIILYFQSEDGPIQLFIDGK